ncbi:C-terminal processing protease CtpA/Prc, contains a PDZ domain [Dyadobacter soli]|uniref:C-terminal processing protease CtpA/Prc, contains a PDZ domain n=1 Tax=Dyadobacter soli TaxID=659014 RepID=A0A1G7CWE4_9BACT|nr:S41 family peptidase [Dyadobacter soli]SDE42966.1 C-terminal processing protease CtpA/Prc, contains a PDZ domain [Dyadobacter soli]
MKAFSKQISGLLILLATMAACQPDNVDTLTGKLGDKGSVNSWIYDMMYDGYFWYDEMPDKQSLDTTENPDAFFEKLVYQRKVYDRFSLVTDNYGALQQQFNGVVKAYGINYVPAYIDENKTTVALFVSHIIKGSPAANAGLKRGDIVVKIDGKTLTAENYGTFLAAQESVTLTLGKIVDQSLQLDPKTVPLTRTQITEDPVAHAGVIRKKGKTIGYVVYTQFVPGTEADKEKYDNALRGIFADFKAAGVNELVLDLRLNGGGYMSSAVTLASLIVPGSDGKKLFYTEQWNDKYIQYWKKEKGEEALNYRFSQESSNIGSRLNRVFVLTSQGTASASELVVNGLRSYIDVVTVGDHTAGKNLFGALFGDEKKRWDYGIYMMLGQTANADGESEYGTVDGIAPDVAVSDNRFPFLPFGDENETLLNAALAEMGVSAGQPARLAHTRESTRVVPAPLRDTPSVLDGRMIKAAPEGGPLQVKPDL